MPTITTKDGTSIYYKDWGTGQPITFSHGWPLTADAWDAQMLFFGQQGYRVIAHDRRGNGRSSQPWDGNDMDHYADDLAELMNFLDLKNTIMVGHSTGGGEVARYLGRHGTGRVAKAVLISAVPPLMLKTDKNPLGLPMSVFDGIRAAWSPIARSSTKTLPCPSSATTAPARRSPRASRTTSGSQGMTRLAQEPVRHRQSLLRNRLHRRPEEDRHPGPRPPRRRRSDRPHRRSRPCLRKDPEERETQNLSRLSLTACPSSTPTTSTPTSSPSSNPEQESQHITSTHTTHRRSSHTTPPKRFSNTHHCSVISTEATDSFIVRGAVERPPHFAFVSHSRTYS